ncbi:response regulator [Aporhodopirellula aestuarii]|uniref:Response regulator n=1 Tax=Aporhodopirellula aestuarii TaxID=2950107 RepID=A0ABT0U9E3_9BACT|nr:response regulator [Aporhodopirellula aestuarii]MCM2373545.1 response regulator [Aporhodopirellula aestuarii]
MPLRFKVAFLLVEDSAIDAEVFQRALRRHRIERSLHVCQSAKEALEFLRSQPDRGVNERYIIFLDLNMPGTSGHEFLAEIRADEELSSSIVFVLTTSDHEKDIEMAYKRNVAGYFTKSNIDVLMQAIKPYSDIVFPPLIEATA